MKKWNDKSKRRTILIFASIALFFALVLTNVLRQNAGNPNFDPNQQGEIDNTDKAIEEREKPVLEQSEEKEAYNKDTKTIDQEADKITVSLPEDMFLIYDDSHDGIYNASFTDKDQDNMFDFIIVESKEQLEDVVDNMIESGEEIFGDGKTDIKDAKYLGQDSKRINIKSDTLGDILRFHALELDGKHIIISLESYVGSLDYLEKIVNDSLKVK